MIVAVVIAILSNWKLLKMEDGDFKDALCYDVALVPTNVLIWLKKLKTIFDNRLLLLLIDELVCLKCKIQKFRMGKIKHTKNTNIGQTRSKINK